jgi:hypothetical protein
MTISLMVPDDVRSYFYRVHKQCYASLTHDQELELDGLLIDAIYRARNTS